MTRRARDPPEGLRIAGAAIAGADWLQVADKRHIPVVFVLRCAETPFRNLIVMLWPHQVAMAEAGAERYES